MHGMHESEAASPRTASSEWSVSLGLVSCEDVRDAGCALSPARVAEDMVEEEELWS